MHNQCKPGRARATAMFILASIMLFALVAVARAETPLSTVKLRLDIFYYGLQAPILMGIADGIYRKHGLDVQFAEGRGSATTLQTVANGSDDFGLADGGSLILLAAQGMKVKQVFGILQRSPMMVFTMPDKPLATPKDLVGLTGSYTPGAAPEQLFKTFAKKNGLDTSKVKLVSVGDFATRDNLFLTRKVDFDFGFEMIYVPLMQEKCGCKINILRYADFGVPSVGTGVVVSDTYSTKHPGLVNAFAKATQELMEAAIANPSHAVDRFFEITKSNRSRKQVESELAISLEMAHTPATRDLPIGVMAKPDWQATIDLLVENGNIASGTVTPEMVFTNDYLKKD